MAPLAKLVVACLILSSALIQISEANVVIATYWGQNSEEKEGTLAEACDKGHYTYINIAFLNKFGGGQDLPLPNISDHCSDKNPTGCIKLGEDIKICQNKGVKILLSLGGPYGNYSLESDSDAETVATQLWDSYVTKLQLDGIDFHIENGSALYYENLASHLKKYSQKYNRPLYLSASPRCPYPDAYLARAIDGGHFDIVWVRFFNNSACQYDGINNDDALIKISWKAWSLLIGEGKLFLGIPASADVSGYIPIDNLNEKIIPYIRKTANYGGVMVWDRYYDLITNYSSNIIAVRV